jgi:hypothetical protein
MRLARHAGSAPANAGSDFAIAALGRMTMSKLYIPDICAQLDRLKRLCDRLEKVQSDEERYGELTRQIRAETEVLHATICSSPPATARARVGI